jgi:hypothetical protein
VLKVTNYYVKPEGNSGKPEGNTGKPDGNTGKPEGNTGKPEGNTGKPEGNTGKPEGNTGKPEGNTGKPEGNIGKPELLHFITRTILGEQYKSFSSSLCSLFHSPVTSSLLGPNILLNTMFSNTLSFPCSRNISDQVPHPYKRTGKIVVLYIS